MTASKPLALNDCTIVLCLPFTPNGTHHEAPLSLSRASFPCCSSLQSSPSLRRRPQRRPSWAWFSFRLECYDHDQILLTSGLLRRWKERKHLPWVRHGCLFNPVVHEGVWASIGGFASRVLRFGVSCPVEVPVLFVLCLSRLMFSVEQNSSRWQYCRDTKAYVLFPFNAGGHGVPYAALA